MNKRIYTAALVFFSFISMPTLAAELPSLSEFKAQMGATIVPTPSSAPVPDKKQATTTRINPLLEPIRKYNADGFIAALATATIHELFEADKLALSLKEDLMRDILELEILKRYPPRGPKFPWCGC